MSWIRFAERWPKPTAPGDHGAVLCAFPGYDPFVYHPRVDPEGFTDRADFMWLEGFKYPPVPSTAELQQRKVLAKAA